MAERGNRAGSTETARAYRHAIESLFLDQARWHDREALVSEQPEHARSADALRRATALLHDWSPDETDLQYFAQLANVLERKGIPADPELVLRGSTEPVRRFFAVAGRPSRVGTREVLWLVEDIFNETVERYEDAVFSARS